MTNDEMKEKVVETSVLLQQQTQTLDKIDKYLEKMTEKIENINITTQELQRDILKLSLKTENVENKLNFSENRILTLEDERSFNIVGYFKQSIIPVMISAIFIFFYEKFTK